MAGDQPSPKISDSARRRRSAGSFLRQTAGVRAQAAEAGRRARRRLLLILVPLLAGLVLIYIYRVELFGVDKPVRLAVAAALVAVGWAFARNLDGVLQPQLARRLDPVAAGVGGF